MTFLIKYAWNLNTVVVTFYTMQNMTKARNLCNQTRTERSEVACSVASLG